MTIQSIYSPLQQFSTPRFFVFDTSGNPSAHNYGNVYFREKIANDSFRLVIGSNKSKIDLILELSSTFSSESLYLLYVLLIPQAEHEKGRYASPIVPSHETLSKFLNHYKEFLENDGRHHLWVASTDSDALLVYDQHDVIFAYGNLDKYESMLASHGYAEQKFWFPAPHGHLYMPENQWIVDAMLNQLSWKYSALQEGDEWD